jgi:hypothetical protein
MKKLSIIFSVLLVTYTACAPAAPQPVVAPDPVPADYPERCTVLRLQNTVPALCCSALCDNLDGSPAAHYRSCQQKVLNDYNCTLAETNVLSFGMLASCRCGH